MHSPDPLDEAATKASGQRGFAIMGRFSRRADAPSQREWGQVMTELLFHEDSYLKEFEATVVETTEDGVVLDSTAFYIGGGGQPYDTGVLVSGGQEYPVTRVGHSDGKIVHRIDGPLPEAGAAVTGKIDWERRYLLMRTHTALHILCGVVWRDYGRR